MRILHCIPTMGGGGAERQLAYLLPLLAERGWDVRLGYLHDGPNLRLLRDANVTLYQPKHQDPRDPRTAIELFHYLRRVRPDIVQTWLLYMDVAVGAACRLLHIPWVMTERSAGPMRHCRFYRNLPRKYIGAGASAIASNSASGDEYWTRVAGKRAKRVVIPNCLPMERFKNLPDPVDARIIAPDEKVVLYVGRLDVEKNIETLVPALKEILSKRSDVAVVLCGDGPRFPAAKAALKNGPGAARAHVLGYTPDAWSWMKRADVLINPSHFEGHPNTVLEAVALGVPLVVSDIPAHRAFLSDDSALFAPTTDVKAWVSRILAVLDDPQSARHRAERARNIIPLFTPDAMADAYDQLYRSLLNPPDA
ncbi:MAG: glycosyltransferase family 4 protein [Phycisphaerae bacterium]|nr:glycosyltransferase family 4 protein [Phycisphaerae bacterium]